MDNAAIEQLRKAHVRHLAALLYDLVMLPETSPAQLRERIVLEGGEHLRGADQTGGLLIGSHLGNIWLRGTGLAAHGFQVANVASKIPVPALEQLFRDIRKRHGITTQYVGAGARTLAEETFARRGFFLISFDIATPARAAKSCAIPFGDATIDVDLGPEKFALTHQVPLFWLTIRNTSRDRTIISIEPLPVTRGVGTEEEAHALAVTWTEKLYREVLERPEEWWHWNNLVLGTHPRNCNAK
jgi:lauroyl/myristoyl acyltransferase